MNAKRVKRLRKELKERGTPATNVEYALRGVRDKTVTLSPGCGRSHYQNTKKLPKKFGM